MAERSNATTSSGIVDANVDAIEGHRDVDRSPLSLSRPSPCLAPISNLTNASHTEPGFGSPPVGVSSTSGDYSDFLADDQRPGSGNESIPVGASKVMRADPAGMVICTPEMSARNFEKFLHDPNFVGMDASEMVARSGLAPLPAEVGSSFMGGQSPNNTGAIGRGITRPMDEQHPGLGPSLVMGDDIMGQYAKFFDPTIGTEPSISKNLSNAPCEWETTKPDRSPIMARDSNIVLPPGRKPINSQFGMDRHEEMNTPLPLGPLSNEKRSLSKKKSSKPGLSPPKPPSTGKIIKKGNEKSGSLPKTSARKSGDPEDPDSESFDAFDEMCSIGSKEKMTPEEKRRRRAESNRLSAERSRERRKKYLKDLELGMSNTKRENQDARAKLNFYRQQITVLQEIIRQHGTAEQQNAADAVANALTRYQSERPLSVSTAIEVPDTLSNMASPVTPSASLETNSPVNSVQM